MTRFSTTLLLLVIAVTWCYGQDSTPVYKDATPCDGYWELSYQHPYLMVADSLWDHGAFNEAAKLYETAANKFTSEKNWRGLVKSTNRISNNLSMSQPSDTIVKILEGNLNIISEHLNDDPVELAEVYHTIGVFYDHRREVEKSLNAHNQAQEIRRDHYGETHFDIARGHRAIGELYRWDFQYLNAVEYLNKAANLLTDLGCENSLEAGNAYYTLASAYRTLADYEKASIFCFKALSIFEIYRNKTFEYRANCYSLLGNINFNKGEYQSSNHHNSVAIKMLSERPYLTRPLQRKLATYMNNQARTHAKQGSYDSAFHYLRNSLKINKSIPGNDARISLILQNIGINYTDVGQFDSAYYYLSDALMLSRNVFGEKHFRTSNMLRFMGKLFESNGQLDSSMNYYQGAIVAGSGENFKNYQWYANPDPESLSYDGSLLEALWEKGVVLQKIYQQHQNLRDLELSLETLLIAIAIMDQNQELYELEGSTLLMARDYYGVFEDALNACYELYGITNDNNFIETAFMVIEKSKARLLFDTFSDLQKNKMVGIPDSLIMVEHAIKAELASATRDLEYQQQEDSVNHQKIQKMEEKVFQNAVRLEHFYDSLESTYPSYANAVKTELLELNAIRNKLTKEHRILVNYFWGNSTLFSLVVQEDQVSLFKQPIDPINRLVKKYQQHLQVGPQFNNQAARFKEYSDNAFELYKWLFRGIQLKEKPLIIAADGPLRFIPFEGLVVEKPGTNIYDYDKLKYAVHYYPTSYVYSANLWALQQAKMPTKLRALGFSHSDLNKEKHDGLNQLPGTAQEIEVVKSQMKGLFFSGLEATKQHFINHAQEYDIIHLAIHGISDSISHLNNRLLFRSPDNEDQADPLYIYELYNLRLNSRLAVLSACESGIGRNYRGEGVYSMSRAFSYAGCPTTVMSLWTISDKTTPKILEQFYRQIFKGLDVDQALRRAKLSYLNENSKNMAHPGLWASMVVHGDSHSIVKSNPMTIPLILLAIIILAILGYRFKLMRIKKS